MSSLTIVLTETTKIQNVLLLDGRSSKSYPFVWNDKLGRYAYRTSSQAEVNDLIENAGFNQFYHFSVILPAEVFSPTPRPLPPFTEPSDAKALSRDQLVSLLNGTGLYTGPKETTDKFARMVEALFVGYVLGLKGERLVIPEIIPVTEPAADPVAPAQ